MAALALGAGRPARAQSSCAPGQDALIIYHAGSLSAAFSAVEKLFTQPAGLTDYTIAFAKDGMVLVWGLSSSIAG